jgi:acetyl-CoA carboxylase biotin carboxyl carrier protein
MAKKQKKKTTQPTREASRTNLTVSPKNAGGPMDPNLLEQFVRLMRENDVSSLEVSDGPHRISLQRGPQFTSAPVQYSAPLAAAQASSTPAPAAKPQAPAEEDLSNLKPIKSPMVGTFYSAPSPDAKPFVQVGATVNEDSDVCVIEAMKVFNNIKAEVRGTIAKILVENGKSVEFGTVLFLVKP